MKLTEKQQRIVDNIYYGEPKPYYLKGYAGTGKTVTSSYLAIALEGVGRILIVAPTATALSVIQRKVMNYALQLQVAASSIDFKTLAALITRHESIVVSDKGMKFTLDEDGIEGFKQFIKGFGIREGAVINSIRTNSGIDYIVNIEELNNAIREKTKLDFGFRLESEFILLKPEEVKLGNHNLIIVDESSMVDVSEMQVLNEAAKQKEAKVVWVGDDKQLPPVNGILSNEFRTSKDNLLTDVLRSDDEIIQYATKIREGSINSLLSKTEITNDLNSYLHDNLKDLLKYDVCLTYQNKDVDLINKVLRANYTNSQYLTVGEPIVVTQNARNFRAEIIVFNSQRMKIEEILSIEDTLFEIDQAFLLDGINDYNDDRYLNYSRLVAEGKLRLVKVTDDNDMSSKLVFTNINMESWRMSSYDRQVCEAIAKTCQSQTSSLVYMYWKSAYAMTVHKAQGSEWDKVAYFYQINRRSNPQNNQLDYTAVTRAKSELKIIAFTR